MRTIDSIGGIGRIPVEEDGAWLAGASACRTGGFLGGISDPSGHSVGAGMPGNRYFLDGISDTFGSSVGVGMPGNLYFRGGISDTFGKGVDVGGVGWWGAGGEEAKVAKMAYILFLENAGVGRRLKRA